VIAVNEIKYEDLSTRETFPDSHCITIGCEKKVATKMRSPFTETITVFVPKQIGIAI
jgi:hypothetical protein